MEGQKRGMKRKACQAQGGASRLDPAAVIGRQRGRWPAAAVVFYLTGGMVRYQYWIAFLGTSMHTSKIIIIHVTLCQSHFFFFFAVAFEFLIYYDL